MTVTVFGYLILISIVFYNFLSVFSLHVVLVSIENIYQTLETVFHRLSKHLEFRCLDIPMNHFLSCLIYYMKHECYYLSQF